MDNIEPLLAKYARNRRLSTRRHHSNAPTSNTPIPSLVLYKTQMSRKLKPPSTIRKPLNKRMHRKGRKRHIR